VQRYPSILALALVAACLGCQGSKPPILSATQLTKPSAGIAEPKPLSAVEAWATPPAGWAPEPLKSSSNHQHQVWVSPSGHTAYGIICFSLPLPVSPDFVLPFFMNEFKNDQGDATLISKAKDSALPGLRFEADGGLYHMSVNLLTSGSRGWAVYASTLRNEPINKNELDLAVSAREYTRVGLPPGLLAAQ
jgi:hypothetical protein